MSELVTPSALEVVLVSPPPHLPLILCQTGFMTTLSAVEVQANELAVIKDAVGAQSAANLLQRATKAKSELNKQRLDLIRPFQDQIDAINRIAKGPDGRLDAIKKTLSAAQTAFAVEQARLAREAEAERQRKLAALETQRLAELKAAKDRVDAIAKQLADEAAIIARAREEAVKAGLILPPAPEPEEIWEELSEPEPAAKTATELAIEAVKFAPVVAPVKAQGVRTVTTLVPFVTDVNKLPDFFVDKTPRLAAIRSTFCAGFKAGDAIPVCEGVRFEVQTSTQSTGKGAF